MINRAIKEFAIILVYVINFTNSAILALGPDALATIILGLSLS